MRNHIPLKGKLKRNKQRKAKGGWEGQEHRVFADWHGSNSTQGFFTPFPFNYVTHRHPQLTVVTYGSPSSAAHHRPPRLTVLRGSPSFGTHRPPRLTVLWDSSSSAAQRHLRLTISRSSTFISPIPASVCPALAVVSDHSYSSNQKHPHRLVFRVLSSMLACSLEDCIGSFKVLPSM